MQKAENYKVLLLPNAENILVLLSLPFKFINSCKGDSTEIQVTYTFAFYSGFTFKKTNIAIYFNRDYTI